MESSMEINNYGSHEIKITDRSIINLTGINKISSFDDQEFLMESNMGIILLKGEGLEKREDNFADEVANMIK